MGSVRDFHLPLYLATINRFASNGSGLPARTLSAAPQKFIGEILLFLVFKIAHSNTGAAFGSTDIRVCACRCGLPLPAVLSPEVAMAAPVIERLGLAPGRNFQHLSVFNYLASEIVGRTR
jgi:hypothetical protein